MNAGVFKDFQEYVYKTSLVPYAREKKIELDYPSGYPIICIHSISRRRAIVSRFISFFFTSSETLAQVFTAF